ncbi:MAG: hypothetical protein ACODAQ_11615, partial [Phycisphaeraceae bacterium]
LDLRVNDQPVGSTVSANNGVRVRITCHAEAEIRSAVLICGEHVLRRWTPNALDVVLDETIRADELPGRWLYLRLQQADGERAWTTPIWLELDAPAASHGLARWDEPDPDRVRIDEAEAAAARHYLSAVRDYLEREEDAAQFREIQPVRMLTESNGRAALFFCRYGRRRDPMQIRWYPDFEMPRIRYDWGYDDFGAVHELKRAAAGGGPERAGTPSRGPSPGEQA